jgi:hypothetical protein
MFPEADAKKKAPVNGETVGINNGRSSALTFRDLLWRLPMDFALSPFFLMGRLCT